MSNNEIGSVLRAAGKGIGSTPSETEIHARARRRQRRGRLFGGSGAVVAVVLVAAVLAVLQSPENAQVTTNGLAPASSVEPTTPKAAPSPAGAPSNNSSSGNVSGSGTDGSLVPEVPPTLPPTTLPGQSPPPQHVFTPPPSGTRLYFLGGGTDIVSTRLDGTDRVVVLSGYYGLPIDVWPDGSKLLITTSEGGGTRIVTLDLSTGERRTILQKDGVQNVDLSPDGTRLAYNINSGRIQTGLGPYKSPHDIHIVNVDGSGDRVLVAGERPLWAADGSKLLVQYCGDSGGKPCTIKPDGNDYQPINGIAYAAPFSWSPDGQWLAGKDGNGRLSLARLDGSQKHTIGKMMGSTAPAWTPDGARIIYERLPEGRNPSNGQCGSGCDGAFGLSSVAVDGTGEFRVTTTHDANPVIG